MCDILNVGSEPALQSCGKHQKGGTHMTIIWRLFYPIAIYDFITTCCFFLMTDQSALAVQGIAAIFTIAVIFPVYIIRQKRNHSTAFTRSKAPRKTVPVVLLLIIMGISACISVNNLIDISGLKRLFSGHKEMMAVIHQPPLWQQLLSAGLLIPAAEELVFRGMGYAALRQWFLERGRTGKTDKMLAAVISAFIFGVYHGNVVQGLYAFLMSLILAWSYELCGGLPASLTVHAAANITALIAESAAFDISIQTREIILITIVCGIILAAAMTAMRRTSKEVSQ